MSAVVLRRAAALMRERAENVALTDWFCTSADEERYDGYDVWTHDDQTHWTVATSDYADTAAHIASWHPAVALAVANWLDMFAAVKETGNACAFEDQALTVARAYLGEGGDQ